jgi:hypothetical protein
MSTARLHSFINSAIDAYGWNRDNCPLACGELAIVTTLQAR